MLNLVSFSKIGFIVYIFIYLIFPNLAISQNTKIDIRKNLENALNSRDMKLIKENFRDETSSKITEKFSKIIKEFPNSKWQIKQLSTKNSNQHIFDIKVRGRKIINGEIYLLQSNFQYLFYILNGKINESSIKKLLTTVRSDQNKIDIIFRIPDQVLTGTKYDLDIILSEPLGEIIIAGGLKAHQDDSYLKQEIPIEPLVSGGIFKMTRAPLKPGTQIWSGIIAHPEGMVSFTKTVAVVEKI